MAVNGWKWLKIARMAGNDWTLAWTKNPKLWVGWSLMVANDVSIPRECFAKISEFLKRNWLRAAHIQFTMGFTMAKIAKT